ncbi:GNAT family N-acetyltransferase [Nocardioides panacisoli]|uniref:N-acetyltransferase domain-containing protein n=1 Tax=Nocardioides panacisoli TaxID=627624 RepID=A0ABP7J053_9ACTN
METLRPSTEEDLPFLREVYAASRAEELDQVEWPPGQREAFVRMQFDLQDAQYRGGNPDGSFDVVEVDGTPAGRLYVDRRPDDIRIIDIALLPRFRGAGIGGRLLQALLDEAAASRRTASIHVEVHNRAARLYERLGFRPAAERGLYRLMEWSAA